MNNKIHVGEKFNKLTIVDYVAGQPNSENYKCLCDCGKIKWTNGWNLSSGNVTSCGCINKNKSNIKKFVGKKIGHLTILGFDTTRVGRHKWKFECDCGKICYSNLSLVRLGLKKTCSNKDCRFAQAASFRNRFSQEIIDSFRESIVNKLNGINSPFENNEVEKFEIPAKKWSNMVRSASSRDIELAISKEYAQQIYFKQNGLCSLTKIPISIKTSSLDRIDSNKGYVENNVQWIHALVNPMKLDFDQNYFINLCKMVALFQKNKISHIHRPYVPYVPYVPYNKKTYKGELSCAFWNRMVRKAKFRGIYFDPSFTISDGESLFIKQSGVCSLSGIPIKLRPKWNITASLDRKNSKYGYTKDNSHWVYKHINLMKYVLDIKTFISFCNLIYENFKDVNTGNVTLNAPSNKKQYASDKRKTQQQFVQEIQKIHGDKYDLSEAVYVNSQTKVKVICKKCGRAIFITPPLLKSNKYCKECRKIDRAKYTELNRLKWKSNAKARFAIQKEKNRIKRKEKRREDFIQKAQKIHGDRYNYSLVTYGGYREKIKIICNQCKTTFEQKISNHLAGTHCCPVCLQSWQEKLAKQIKDQKVKKLTIWDI